MATKLELVPASTGKRLGAAVLDWLAPAVALVAAFFVGAAGITQTRSGGYIIYDAGLLVLLTSIALGATLLYGAVLMIIEARTGNTIGNQVMGMRSADADGYASGGGAVFLRGLVTGAGILLAVLAAVLVIAFGWFAVAGLVVLPLFVVGAAWAIVVVVSVAWDREGKLRGWHDKAAKTLAFDIAAGRNPVATGGIQGPYSFAPLDLPPVQHVPSPVPGASLRTPRVINAQPLAPAAAEPAEASPTPAVPAQPVPLAATFQPPATTSPAATSPAERAHPDDDLDRTRMRSERRVPPAVLRIRIDDGQDIELAGTALLGRNPEPSSSGKDGESVEQLVPVADPGRSISKTHLHLRREGDGVWITDRNSTNGSAVTTPDGVQTRLHPGHPIFVRPGSAVHFGDRTFHVGQA